MRTLDERLTLAIGAPLIAVGLAICSLAPDWPDRTYGGVLVVCASVALATTSRFARGAAFLVAAFGAPLLSGLASAH